jgi:hypothetical protein
MPHIRDKNLEIGSALASIAFWHLNKVLIPSSGVICFQHTSSSSSKRSSLKIMDNFERSGHPGRCDCDKVPGRHTPEIYPFRRF